MVANNALLLMAGPYQVNMGGVTRIELRTDGHGLSGYYDMIYIYADDPEKPWRAMPAHSTDVWEYA